MTVPHPEPGGGWPRPRHCRCAIAPRFAASTPAWSPEWKPLEAPSPTERIQLCPPDAVACATCKTNTLGSRARDRTVVPSAHWPPVRRSAYSSTYVVVPSPFQHPARSVSKKGWLTSRLPIRRVGIRGLTSLGEMADGRSRSVSWSATRQTCMLTSSDCGRRRSPIIKPRW